MRPDTGRRPGTVLMATALAGLALAAAAACGQATPTAATGPGTPTGPATPAAETTSAGPAPTVTPTPTAAAGATTVPAAPARTLDPRIADACDAVTAARRTAVDALAPVAAVLGRSGLSRDDLAKATTDLNAVYTAMHVGVAESAELTADAKLKAKIAAYQLAVEQAIVAVEGSDGEQAKLQAVIESPALRTAEKTVLSACA
ncbi:hypothetical protein CS0771_48700 [Catellatospora sp. IY07-71]|uniref:hypothetical protein n=1 Tax=Catellatospora sp. IY07-71 TaxID=2728827 RepID=UPI001BB38444|nr:hypothetical protein [Catellatospora sp. IY07-71]BCJ75326.1 hypothetical protein CS0771_48700 [Catellatospora sp. IY07-71]